MTRSKGAAAEHPAWRKDFVRLRKVAMRINEHLDKMLPPLREPSRKAVEAGTVKIKVLLPGYDRLLADGDGVVDAFHRNTHLVIRLHDKEQERHGATDTTEPFFGDDIDEEELDREIAAELDRIAARQRAAGGPQPDLPDQGGEEGA